MDSVLTSQTGLETIQISEKKENEDEQADFENFHWQKEEFELSIDFEMGND